ncbi:hypothetical protein H1R20_g5933, partial [Candolleomyces eurysporus]|uniref:Plastocyanin-like domain-containing protein n=2 Tax=Candolleomyces TaxID=2791032 RepID=A0A4Q2DT26_9AGAR
MPTSTEPFEVLFEFTNDTADFATLQLTRENASNVGVAGPVIRLFPKDSVSLVLNAGATYHYLVKQSQRHAQIS